MCMFIYGLCRANRQFTYNIVMHQNIIFSVLDYNKNQSIIQFESFDKSTIFFFFSCVNFNLTIVSIFIYNFIIMSLFFLHFLYNHLKFFSSIFNIILYKRYRCVWILYTFLYIDNAFNVLYVKCMLF